MLVDQELRYLPAFLAVAEEGGFHRAAERLHLSQSAVSYQIRMLERTLDVRLFDRVGRGVILTERGRLLREYCRRSLGDLAALKRQFKTGEAANVRTIRVASVSAFGRYVLFPVLLDAFPDLRIDLRFPTQAEVIALVAGGLCDVGFLYEAKVSSTLQCVRVASERIVLVAPFGGPTPKGRAIERFAALPYVTYVEGEYVFGRWFGANFGKQPGSLTSVAHFEELEEVIEYVRRGRGVSIVPDHCARQALESGDLSVVTPFKARPCTNEIFALTRTGASPPAELERLLLHLARES